DIDHLYIVGQINVSVPVEVFEILGRNPPAVAVPAYVATAVVPGASVDIDAGAAGNPIDHRKSGARASPHAHFGCNYTSCGQRCGGGRLQELCHDQDPDVGY